MTVIYTIRWTDLITSETATCEVEAGIAYDCYRSRSDAQRSCDICNATSIAHNWPSRYDVIELPDELTPYF